MKMELDIGLILGITSQAAQKCSLGMYNEWRSRCGGASMEQGQHSMKPSRTHRVPTTWEPLQWESHGDQYMTFVGHTCILACFCSPQAGSTHDGMDARVI